MVQSATNRINKYKAKVSGDISKNRVEAQKDFMIKKQKVATDDLVKIEGIVKGICNGVSTILLPYYIIFGKECYKVCKTHLSYTKAKEILILEKKWTTRGLNGNLLNTIINIICPPALTCDYKASYSPISWSGADYNDRLVYVDRMETDGQPVAVDGVIIDGASGTGGWEYAIISITGGIHTGEKWTLIFSRSAFPVNTDIPNWCDQHSEIGPGNYILVWDWFGPTDSISAEGPCNNYNYNLCATCSYAPGATNPGWLRAT